MTEDEAKTKWCPFSRLTIIDENEGAGGSLNRSVSDKLTNAKALYRGTRCIASACMAWRVRDHEQFFDGKPVMPDTMIVGGEDRVEWRAHGYCGLAGKS